jgi:starch phosphorylase
VRAAAARSCAGVARPRGFGLYVLRRRGASSNNGARFPPAETAISTPEEILLLHQLSLDRQERVAAEFLDFALDLRWTWSHEGDALWRRIDPEAWEITRNPHRVIQTLDKDRVLALFEDPLVREEWSKLVAKRTRYRDSPCWNEHEKSALFGDGCVAYFSMEFGLGEALPLYAGGLGILAGDYLKAASDLCVPLVGVGLLYQQGYFRQLIDDRGEQQEVYTYNDTTGLPVRPARNGDGRWVHVPLHLPGRTVRLRVWQAEVGRVRLYLLDSNDPLNGAVDRGITARLYGGPAEMRLMQEIALGIGGWRALTALGVPVSVCHLNEAHAAFATLERAREYMCAHGVRFWDALRVTRVANVFTTHTPVRAAFDSFPMGLVAKYGVGYAAELGVEPLELAALGQPLRDGEPRQFAMVSLAAQTSGSINAVSRSHAQVSRREVFSAFFPRWPSEQVPVSHVTNGIHVPSWDSSWADELWTGACGKDRWSRRGDELGTDIDALSDGQLWELGARERADLVHFARRGLARQIARRGKGETVAAEEVLDPNVLTLGFARRFTEYKRPNLLLHDPARLLGLLRNEQRPVQIVLAGKAHPDDGRGKELIAQWIRFIGESGARDRIVFLEDYDIAIAQQLTQGVDVWLNTPRRRQEACGTSGMKVLVNGGLNLSIPDGWWAEAYDPRFGWVIPLSEAATQIERDAAEADALYRVLEHEVIPLFYERNEAGIPPGWVAKMRASLRELAPFYSTNRMIREYLERIYKPAVERFRGRAAAPQAFASALEKWERNLRDHWHEIRIGTALGARCAPGRLRVEVAVTLGDVDPDGIGVEIYADPVAGSRLLCERLRRGQAIAGTTNGFFYSTEIDTDRPLEHVTPRVVAFHPDAVLPLELPLIHWATAPLTAVEPATPFGATAPVSETPP